MMLQNVGSCLGLLFVLIGFAGPVHAEEPESSSAYVFLDINTPLQKLFVGQDLTAMAVLNGDVLITEDETDVFELSDFQAALTARAKVDNRSILLMTRMTKPGGPSNARRGRLELTLKRLGNDAEFKKVRISNSYEQGGWNEKIGNANKTVQGQPNQEEVAVTVGNYDIYPVRTFTSSFLTGHADCVIWLKTEVSTADTEILPLADREQLQAAIAKLNLPRRDRALLNVISTGRGRDAVDKFVESIRNQDDVLGFRAVSTRHSFK